MRFKEYIAETAQLMEELSSFLAEDSSVSGALKDLIQSQLETPLDGAVSDINKTIAQAGNKMKMWAMDQLRTVKITDDSHKALLNKIINNPKQVASELAMSILKRKVSS